MEAKALAIITARGGSKRIPKKNIKEFCGKPIIAYSIEAAVESNLFSEVMVSTDSEEIVAVAKKYGAVVPFMRSEQTANDFATTADVLSEVLSEYEKRGKFFDIFCCLYPTAPFVTTDNLREAMEIMQREHPAMIMPVVPFSFPPLRGVVKDERGFIHYKYEQYRNCRSQDLETMYHDVGQFYVYDTKKYLAADGKITDEIFPVIMSAMQVQDIDTLEDWKVAEMKYRLWRGKDDGR